MGVPAFKINAVITAVDKITAPLRSMSRAVTSKLGRALGGVASLAGRATRALRGMLGPIGLLTGGAVLGGLTALVKRQTAAADELGKFARQVGVGVEALQELQFAADRAGVSSSEFRSSLDQLSKRVGELRAGTGSLKTLLDKVSPSFAKTLQGARSNEEALELVIDAMTRLEDPAKRAALANAAFGRSGLKMARLADEGTEGIAKLRAEARRLGLVMSEDTTRSAEEATDRMTDLKAALGGVANALTARLLPKLTPLIEKLTDWVVQNRGLIAQKLESVFEKIGSALSTVGSVLAAVENSVGVVNAAFVALGVVVLANPIFAAVAAIAGLVTIIVTEWDTITEWWGELWDDMLATIRSAAAEIRRTVDAIGESLDVFGILEDDNSTSGPSPEEFFAERNRRLAARGQTPTLGSPANLGAAVGAAGAPGASGTVSVDVRIKDDAGRARVERVDAAGAGVRATTNVAHRPMALGAM